MLNKELITFLKSTKGCGKTLQKLLGHALIAYMTTKAKITIL
jgi:hypothetical protein